MPTRNIKKKKAYIRSVLKAPPPSQPPPPLPSQLKRKKTTEAEIHVYHLAKENSSSLSKDSDPAHHRQVFNNNIYVCLHIDLFNWLFYSAF